MRIHKSQTWAEGRAQLLQHSMIDNICTCSIGKLYSVHFCADCQIETRTAHLAHVA